MGFARGKWPFLLAAYDGVSDSRLIGYFYSAQRTYLGARKLIASKKRRLSLYTPTRPSPGNSSRTDSSRAYNDSTPFVLSVRIAWRCRLQTSAHRSAKDYPQVLKDGDYQDSHVYHPRCVLHVYFLLFTVCDLTTPHLPDTRKDGFEENRRKVKWMTR